MKCKAMNITIIIHRCELTANHKGEHSCGVWHGGRAQEKCGHCWPKWTNKREQKKAK